jgi:HSP20 family molecular chaperone IbpA
MTEKQEDTRKTLEDMVRHLIAAAHDGRLQPFFVGMNVIISPGGGFPVPPQRVRGEGKEPDIEIQRLGDRVLLVTELPGLSPENVQVLFRGDRVFIWGKDGERQYRTSAAVPPPRTGSEQVTFRHGVLEVSYIPQDTSDTCTSPPPRGE